MKINILLIGPNGCCYEIFKNILESNSEINVIESKIITCKKNIINDLEINYTLNSEVLDDLDIIQDNYNFIILLTREINCLNIINNYDNFSEEYNKIINEKLEKYLDKLIFFDYESIILYKDSYIKYMFESLNLDTSNLDYDILSKYYKVDLNSNFFTNN